MARHFGRMDAPRAVGCENHRGRDRGGDQDQGDEGEDESREARKGAALGRGRRWRRGHRRDGCRLAGPRWRKGPELGPSGLLETAGRGLVVEDVRRRGLVVDRQRHVLSFEPQPEAAGELVGARVTPARVPLERPQNGPPQRLGYLAVVGARRQRALVLLAHRQLGEGRALIREPAGEELVEDDAERVDVGGGRRLLAAYLLGREIGGGTDDRSHLGDPRLFDRAGDPEVGQFHRHLAGAERAADDHQVARLDVAVDDPPPVRVVEPAA